MNKPKISIIVPVFNTEKYLKLCLNSILNQSYQNLEIICINDGSTDNSAEILKTYSNKDQRIKVFTQENSGLSAARNLGLAKSTGDYVTFVDSDDEIESEMINTMINNLQNTNSDLAVCSFKETFPNNKTKHFNNNHPQQRVLSTKEALRAMLREEGFMVSATMKLFPKSYFKNIIFPVGKLHEDVAVTYKLIMQAKQVLFTPQEFYIYKHHSNSIISSFNDQKFDLIIFTDQMCDEINQKYPELKNTTNERRIRARFSILRQIPLNHPHVKEIINYLNNHQSYITDNPESTKIDKIALKLACFNPKLFQLAYKLFK